MVSVMLGLGGLPLGQAADDGFAKAVATLRAVGGEGQGNTAAVFVSIVALTLIGVVTYGAVVWAERKVLHYLPKANTSTV